MTGGTLDLDWSALSSELADKLVEILNSNLASTTRPSFIGPINIVSLDFGSAAPDVQLVDVRDIYRDFLEEDEHDRGDKISTSSSSLPQQQRGQPPDDDGFEWVSRREGARADLGAAEARLSSLTPYSYLPPHTRHYGSASAADFLVGYPGFHSPRHVWEPQGLRTMSRLGTMGASLPNLFDARMLRSPLAATHEDGIDDDAFPPPESVASFSSSPAHSFSFSPSAPDDNQLLSQPSAPSNQPDVQLHLRVFFESNLRLTLTTSLQINYPSPLFMSLPVKLSITGLVFEGEIVVAYQGSRSRVHMCILDDLDPYGPSMTRSSPSPQDPVSDPSFDGKDPAQTSPLRPRPTNAPGSKPSPAGIRLLPSIVIESEIGQADKHVLKNVSRVERFIQDVIRKTLEEELVFPNFHTIIIGDEDA